MNDLQMGHKNNPHQGLSTYGLQRKKTKAIWKPGAERKETATSKAPRPNST